MTRYWRFTPPPRWRTVIRPWLFRPALDLSRFLKFRGDFFLVRPLKSVTDICLRPGDVGLYFFIMRCNPYKTSILSPAFRVIIAFLIPDLWLFLAPHFFRLPFCWMVRTETTPTENRRTASSLIAFLVAPSLTIKVYLPSFDWSVAFSLRRGRIISFFILEGTGERASASLIFVPRLVPTSAFSVYFDLLKIDIFLAL